MYLSSFPRNVFPKVPQLSLAQYNVIGTKIVNSMRKKFGTLVDKILNDEDLFSSVLYSIMSADSNFKEGLAPLGWWRYQSAIWTIQNYLTFHTRQKQKNYQVLSLNTKVNSEQELHEILISPKNNINEMENQEEINVLMGRLTEQSKRILNYYFMDNYTMHEIAIKEQLTGARIQQIVSEALNKMRFKCPS